MQYAMKFLLSCLLEFPVSTMPILDDGKVSKFHFLLRYATGDSYCLPSLSHVSKGDV